MMNYKKYKKIETVKLTDRTWPDKEIEQAPIWCSVDLRDGNQALITPMNIDEKIEMFKMLVDMGFKEIEVGFPSSSQIEYDFLRALIDQNLIPDDVTVQVLTQAREHLIRRTFESLKGLKRAIVHIYNSTSVLQRDVVFNMNKEQIKQIAIDGTRLVKSLTSEFDGEVILEYSPESFTGTEMDYAVEICDAVMDEWGASKDKKVIINLPSTVEMNTPNVYADQIEYCCRNFKDRDRVIVSVHPHNDRGCGVASTELALLAGADRVEGTLFGNGERTGNVDIINVAMNMFTHGIDPKLEMSQMNQIKEVYERVTKMEVEPRHPYAGQLVFTAFSGSHQDAINKGMKAYKERNTGIWEVPYLPIDPADLNRQYEPIVRINSQSGKGGVAFVMDTTYGFRLPKALQQEFSKYVQTITEKEGEISPERIYEAFKEMYLDVVTPYTFKKYHITDTTNQNLGYDRQVEVMLEDHGEVKVICGVGNGPIDSVKNALDTNHYLDAKLIDYQEHALTSGANAKAAAYVELQDKQTGKTCYGVGVDENINIASIKAIFSATNRIYNILKK